MRYVFTKRVSVNYLKNKKSKTVLHGFLKWQISLILNRINYGLIKEEFYNSPLQKLLNHNDILIYSTYNESKSVVAERFKKASKVKIYKNLKANYSKYYFCCLKKLVGEYNKTDHHSIGKKSIDADYSNLTEKSKNTPNAPIFIVGDRVTITTYENIYVKVTLKVDQKKCL